MLHFTVGDGEVRKAGREGGKEEGYIGQLKKGQGLTEFPLSSVNQSMRRY